MNCKCHNKPRVWQTDRRKKSGGYWRCDFKHKNFRALNPEYTKRDKINKTRRRRRRLINHLTVKIDNLINDHPFLKEVMNA